MLQPKTVLEALESKGISFFAGVPDSLLKNFCTEIDGNISSDNHIITANEGGAVALAAGHALATGTIPCVYMQNSGLGNAINPLVSLVDKDVYSIPLLLIIGWRGEPGVHDEPQHVRMGESTTRVLEAIDVPYAVLPDTEEAFKKVLETAFTSLSERQAPYALLVKKGTFDEPSEKKSMEAQYSLTREAALACILRELGKKDIVVGTTGKLSRELFELREQRGEGHERDFLTVGSMGHASQIALGIALEKPERNVVCLDGDGAFLMHMGGLATIGERAPKNFIHIVCNNGCHESVGGQATAGFFVSFTDIAKGCGYKEVASVTDEKEITEALKTMVGKDGPHLLEICIKKGARSDLGRPTTSPQENVSEFVTFVS